MPKDPAVQGAVGDAAMALNTPSEAFDPSRQPIEDDSDVPEGDEDPDAVAKNDPQAAKRAKKEKKLKKELDKIKKKGQSKKGFGPDEFAKLKASGVAGMSMNQIKDSDPLKFMQLQHLMNLESKGISWDAGS